MAKQLDQILVIDVEATCWESGPPPGQTHEIIEVGLCVLDVASGERLEKRSILVKPVCSTVSPFCTALTTLTQAEVDTGAPFVEACRILREDYSARRRLWASWGDYDRRQFQRQCDSFGVPYPFGATHLNVKALFAITHALPREVGLPGAAAILGLPMEGTHHRGVDDAWNIAAILSRLLMAGRGE